jgi:prevent-host-death family protein
MAEADPKIEKMMVNVHEAKTNFSRLIERAHSGEEIILAKAGKPWARLVPLSPPEPARGPRKPGRYKHLLKEVPSDIWFEPTFTDEELDGFEAKLDDI